MKKAKNNSRYLRSTSQVFYRTSIEYTEKERKKIVSSFPKEKQEDALKETIEHVSKLVSWLGSKTTPRNIKRKESVQQIRELHDCLQSLEIKLKPFLSGFYQQNTIELKKKFYGVIKKGYPSITLQTLDDLIAYFKLACKEVIKRPGRPGRENQAYYEAVDNLACVWKRYTKNKPTLHNKSYKVDEYKDSQRPCGPFLDYLNISIKSAIRHSNKKRKKCKKKEILLEVSLPNIAREVIRSRKESMA